MGLLGVILHVYPRSACPELALRPRTAGISPQAAVDGVNLDYADGFMDFPLSRAI